MACPEVVVIYIYLQDFYNYFANYNYTALFQDLDYLTRTLCMNVKVDDVEVAEPDLRKLQLSGGGE